MTDEGPFVYALKCLDLMVHRAALRLRARFELSADEFRGLYISDAQVDALLKARQETAAASPLCAQLATQWPVAMATLARQDRWKGLVRRLGLTVGEEQVLLIALAPHLDAKYAPLFAYLNDNIGRPYLTVDLIMRLLDWGATNPARWMLGAKGKLRRFGLLGHVPDSAPEGFALEDGLAAYLMGAPLSYAVAVEGVQVHEAPACRMPSLPPRAGFTDQLATASAHLGKQVIGLIGEAGSGRATYARDLLSQHVAAVFTVDARPLARGERPAAALRQAVVLAAISDSALLVQSAAELSADFLLRDALQLATDLNVPTLLLTDQTASLKRLCPTARPVPVSALSVTERKATWEFHLQGHGLHAEAQAIWSTADLFALRFGAIAAAVEALCPQAGSDRRLTADQLNAAARDQSSAAFSAGAAQVADRYDFDDLVLAPAVRDRINDFITATRHRRTVYETWNMQRRLGPARGLVAMFTGASGTGKSMAASVIAKALGLDLYRIELSAIVSKYIGETEKNLDAIFNAAREANAILFFDEADALFGKRSEVKEAHDRYANIECAYLLQKMERHDGIVILTTNMPRGLDAAFSRRIQFVIDFPRPDAALRETLWAGMFPPEVPLAGDVDFAFLARNFENTGGEIRNIALDAALRTAGQPGAKITMQALLKAVERQLVKQGRAPTAAAFKQHFKLVQQATG
ncbi:ATP-binding protein [Tateyamaria omphalii]|uniref:AAA+ ATPase domain-containing protein n=1 Tax=Tateyamaria omphalii TaxID=299262 RepID=A0A1P8MVF1_9RHOB|nr:ATP-binding protein [Tateyamaria omphalii]APX11972.1 hypothetical protein BWR18_10010 [Tateyamaria omphalii]